MIWMIWIGGPAGLSKWNTVLGIHWYSPLVVVVAFLGGWLEQASFSLMASANLSGSNSAKKSVTRVSFTPSLAWVWCLVFAEDSIRIIICQDTAKFLQWQEQVGWDIVPLPRKTCPSSPGCYHNRFSAPCRESCKSSTICCLLSIVLVFSSLLFLTRNTR